MTITPVKLLENHYDLIGGAHLLQLRDLVGNIKIISLKEPEVLKPIYIYIYYPPA